MFCAFGDKQSFPIGTENCNTVPTVALPPERVNWIMGLAKQDQLLSTLTLL